MWQWRGRGGGGRWKKGRVVWTLRDLCFINSCKLESGIYDSLIKNKIITFICCTWQILP